MKPREPVETGQGDMFRSRLDQILDMGHEKVGLAQPDRLGFFDPGMRRRLYRLARPPAIVDPVDGGAAFGRKMIHRIIFLFCLTLKYADNLSDEELCACWEEFFRHDLPFDRSSMTRWRQRMGDERLAALLQESLSVAVKVGAAKPSSQWVTIFNYCLTRQRANIFAFCSRLIARN